MFETERLWTRPWTLDDAEAAHRMYGDPEVMRYIGDRVDADVAATRELLEQILGRIARLPPGMGSVPLFTKSDDELVGAALIKPLPDGDSQPTGDIEIGWHLVRAHWGRGYATEAGRALLAHGFETLDLDPLHAVVEPPNEASHAVARRLGLVDVGRTTDYYEGKPLTHYVLARDAWRAAREAASP